jgi:hypothetical protein
LQPILSVDLAGVFAFLPDAEWKKSPFSDDVWLLAGKNPSDASEIPLPVRSPAGKAVLMPE